MTTEHDEREENVGGEEGRNGRGRTGEDVGQGEREGNYSVTFIMNPEARFSRYSQQCS